MDVPAGILLCVLAACNLAAFGAQGLDKRKASRGEFRLSERTLLLLGVPLAAPGMLLGMQVFRHKTRKRTFLLKAAAVVFANLLIVAALGWLAMKGHFRVGLALY